jgi:3-deoxy-manno-octulosonate cytidylyltransferase (CMP-KDO synthetase)
MSAEKNSPRKQTVAIIPARYAASRLPGKPLTPILDKPMVQRVYEQASLARVLDAVWVATDDARIRDAVAAFGGNVVMTSPECASGTDRLAEAVAKIEGDLFVNVQGDQPFIDPIMIEEVVEPMWADPSLPMATLIHPIEKEEDLRDPGVVKTVIDLEGNGLYFSRSLIPAPQNPMEHTVYEHVGLYVYRRDFLIQLAALPQTTLEKVEGLEQLRVLEHGHRLRCIITTCADNELSGFSIDTPDDVKRGETMLLERGLL